MKLMSKLLIIGYALALATRRSPLLASLRFLLLRDPALVLVG